MIKLLPVLFTWLLISLSSCNIDLSDGDSGTGNSDNGGTGNNDPLALITIDQLTFSGAFRFTNEDFGVSDVNYAVGTLAYNPENHSLFIAGHSHQNAIAEFPIVASGMQTQVADLPETGEPIQPFASVLNTVNNPDGLNKITGLLWVAGSLIINAETWYDAGGDNTDTTLVIDDADDLTGQIDGYFKMSGAAHSAGYMGPIPAGYQEAFNAKYFTGWSSVYSIVSRYSVGPSLWTFAPSELIDGYAGTAGQVTATPFINYAFNETHLSDRAVEYEAQGKAGPFPPASPLWNILSKGVYAFFVPGTRTFAVIGSSGGIETGVGYKAIQDDGYECGGPCAYGADDAYNYYWLFDIDDILAAENVFDPQPYDYGIWELPFDDNGNHRIIGATVDPEDGVLYVALGNAGQVGAYDRPPLVLTYALPSVSE